MSLKASLNAQLHHSFAIAVKATLAPEHEAHLHVTVFSVKTSHTHGIVISVKTSQNLT